MRPRINPSRTQFLALFLLLGLTPGLILVAWFPVQAYGLPPAVDPADRADAGTVADVEPRQTTPSVIYLPLLSHNYPWISPFGVEPTLSLTSATLMNAAVDLRANWIRLNGRISWRTLQPSEGAAIDWAQLAGFENELRALRAQGMTPMVIVDDHPEWATIEEYGADGARSWCAAIRPDKYEAFAQFMRALVARYETSEFNVHYWELGNEPDVDPGLLLGSSAFGCWGDIDDPYYGGGAYGEMLKVVAPAMRAEDPQARVVLGGLLLDKPQTTDPNLGRPELFLEGILRAGAGPYFDVLAYHAYPSYWGAKTDCDLYGNVWKDWGGMVLGKALYLQQVLARYGVDKPLFVNETALGCPPHVASCDPPDAQFFQVQASHVTRSFVRGLSRGVMGFTWFTLNGPGWRYTGLLEADGTPQPVYVAYQQLTHQLNQSRYLHAIDYGPGLEAYVFDRGAQQVHVVWAIADELLTVSVPAVDYAAAYGRDGNLLSPTLVGTYFQLQVGFEPIYVILNN